MGERDVKKISHQENAEYIYGSESERDAHVKFMETLGWSASGRRKKFHGGVHKLNPLDGDFDWYAGFWRFPE